MPSIVVHLIAVCGGLGLFFLGMKFMGDGLELAAGSKLRVMLEKITSNKYLGMLVGLVVTAVIQSSSATAAMVVGFTNAGMMELAQTVGILFGSKIGTCMTSVLLTFDIGAIIPLVILAGVLVWMFAKKNNVKHIAMIFAGFGILFYGMTVMSSSLKALNENGMIDNILLSINSPIVGLLIGTLITAIIQSSSASVGILMALAIATNMDINQAIFIVYGMNLGACMPAFLSAVGTRRQAKQVAILNLLITLFGVVVLTPLTLWLPVGDWIAMLAPNAPGVQVSISHIFFNVANMALLMPFSKMLVILTQKMLPLDPDEESDKMKTEYIDDLLLSAPPMAVLQCEKEVERMTNMVKKNYHKSVDVFFDYIDNKNYSDKEINKILSREKTIDYLCKAITEYIVKINGTEIQDDDRMVIAAIYSAIQDLERIGDYAENMVEFLQSYKEMKSSLSDTAIHELRHIFDLSLKLVDDSFEMFLTKSATPQQIEKVVRLEDEIDDCKDAYKSAHIKRMHNGQCGTRRGALFLNMLTDIERVGDHAIDVAFVIPNFKNRLTKETTY